MGRLLVSILALSAAGPALAAERAFPTGGAFDRISNSTPFEVVVHTGQAASVRATGSDAALGQLQIENRGGELRIGTKPSRWFSMWNWRRGERARIEVTVPMISAANLSGPGNLRVDAVRTRSFRGSVSGPGSIAIGALEAADVGFTLSGPGNIAVAGRAGQATLNVSGPGAMRAAKLVVGNAVVSLSGPGNIDANVSRTADIRVSGPGDVHIRGGARCSIQKSGPGHIDCG